MNVTIEFSKSPAEQSDVLIFPAFKKGDEIVVPAIKDVSKKAQNEINRILDLTDKQRFSAKEDQILSMFLPHGCSDITAQIVIAGFGDLDAWNNHAAEDAGGRLFAKLSAMSFGKVSLLGRDLGFSENLLAGYALRSYKFDKYKSAKDQKKTGLTLCYVAGNFEAVSDACDALSAEIVGVYFARDLVNEAPNVLYPESYAQRIKDELKPLGVDVEILNDKKMLKLGMGGIMAVGQGSARQPRMVIMRWRGAGVSKTQKPVALVGKGVTFDTGGISIKPSAGMDEMKMDMGGSAAVVGTMKALALSKSESHVVGIVGLAENMPSSNAYRPGDIITSYSGKTIEVLNTDAEGRLVLCDAISYVQDKYDPVAMIDLATLTGAILVALGTEYCGTFSNDDEMWTQLEAASKTGHEKLWRMPLDKVWSKEMVSDVADLRNIGKSRFGGSCTAAEFLHHFVDEGRKWTHMDIAGTAWVKADQPIAPKYGIGFGVRTLNAWVAQFYEQK